MCSELNNQYCAPLERTPVGVLDEQIRSLGKVDVLNEIADSVPDVFVILNQEREVVFANMNTLELVDAHSIDDIKGQRPGEVFKCSYAWDRPTGCGTSDHCPYCGAATAILGAQRGARNSQECRINNTSNQALTMQVWATPYLHEEHYFVILVMEDISNSKERDKLDRMFYHDIMNTAGGITGLISSMMRSKTITTESDRCKLEMIRNSANDLIAEIESHRQLLNAEKGDYELQVKLVNSYEILLDIASMYLEHQVCSQRSLLIHPDASNSRLLSDPVIIKRVIGNMTKNALEASSPGDCVTLSCSDNESRVVFSVHNSKVIPDEVKYQIFQKSFSTKGTGRGTGTFSMKLFGESYLRGKVHFRSNESCGTVFYLDLPKKFPVGG